MRTTRKRGQVTMADLTDADRREVLKMRDFLGIVSRAKAAGGRDLGELFDAFYGPDGSGEDRRDFTRRTS
jgi:hypothetical protein